MCDRVPRTTISALLLLLLFGATACRDDGAPAEDPTPAPAPVASGRPTLAPAPEEGQSPICAQIEAADYTPLPRSLAPNRFDPSGLAAAGGQLWVVNDRECREGVPEDGPGVYLVDPRAGGMSHVPVPGFDSVSRKFEGLAWDGEELHAIGNVGDRKANTFLVSFPIDMATGAVNRKARFHDLADALGRATGLGPEPWGKGIKIEALAALGPGDLLIGLRATGDGKAARAYRTRLPRPDAPLSQLELTPVAAFDDLQLGVGAGGPDGQRRVKRTISGLADAVGDPSVVLGVASAELENDEVGEGENRFLSNALFAYWPASGQARMLCAFDEGRKAEGVAYVPDAAPADDGTQLGTLYILYDNDDLAPGGYRSITNVPLPGPPR